MDGQKTISSLTEPLSPLHHHMPLSREDKTFLETRWTEMQDYKALCILIIRPWGNEQSTRAARKFFFETTYNTYFKGHRVSSYFDARFARFLLSRVQEPELYTKLGRTLFTKHFSDQRQLMMPVAYASLSVIDAHVEAKKQDSNALTSDEDQKILRQALFAVKSMAKKYPVFAVYYGTYTFMPEFQGQDLDLLQHDQALNLIKSGASANIAFSHAQMFSNKNPQNLSLTLKELQSVFCIIRARKKSFSLKKAYARFQNTSKSILS